MVADLSLENAQYLFVRNQSPILGIILQNVEHLFVRNNTPFKHVSVAVNKRLNLVFRKFVEEFLSHVNPWSKFNQPSIAGVEWWMPRVRRVHTPNLTNFFG